MNDLAAGSWSGLCSRTVPIEFLTLSYIPEDIRPHFGRFCGLLFEFTLFLINWRSRTSYMLRLDSVTVLHHQEGFIGRRYNFWLWWISWIKMSYYFHHVYVHMFFMGIILGCRWYGLSLVAHCRGKRIWGIRGLFGRRWNRFSCASHTETSVYNSRSLKVRWRDNWRWTHFWALYKILLTDCCMEQNVIVFLFLISLFSMLKLIFLIMKWDACCWKKSMNMYFEEAWIIINTS